MNIIRMIILPLVALLGLCAPSFGQVEVRLEPVRRDYVLGEKAALKLMVTNHTDSVITLSGTPGRSWLYLAVSRRGEDGLMSPVTPPHYPDIKVMPGSRKEYRIELQPFYRFTREGTYRVTATLRMPDRYTTYSSNSTSLNMTSGGSMRKFDIQSKGRRLEMHLRVLVVEGKTVLFGQVVDPQTRIAIGACFMGQYLNFMQPKVLLDRAQNMHVLCQSTADFFTYSVMDVNGTRRAYKLLQRVGWPIDLVSTGNGIKWIGLREYKQETNPNAQFHDATERP